MTPRIAVSTFFFTNGFLYANWTSRLPEFQRFVGISNTLLGTLLFILSLGAVIAMPLSGWITTQFGSRRITQFSGFLFCFLVAIMAFWPNLWLISPIFFVIGFASGSLDVAMNAQAVYVERLLNKPIMSSFHAVFSIGMAVGAGVGALFAQYHFPLSRHFLIASLACVPFLLWASKNLLTDAPTEKNQSEGSHFVLPSKAILPLGIIAFCCMLGEGSTADWSAIYMNKVIGESEVFAALTFGCFSATMTIGRIFGDYFTTRLGKRKLLIFDSVLAILGLSIALLFQSTPTTLIGFSLVGLGLSTIVPIVYSTAGNTKGINPSVGIAMATTIGYAGFFVGPPTIGYISDVFSLRLGLCFTLFLFVVMLFTVLRNVSVKNYD